MRRLVLFAFAVLVGCNLVGDPASDQPLFVVSVLSPTGGTFTALHFNAFGAGGGSYQTYTGTGSFQEVNRSTDDGRDTSLQEIRGIYTGDSLIVGFGTRRVNGEAGANGGALAGSLQTAEGPHLQTLPCRVRYGASGASGSAYRVTFRMTADLGRVCRQP